MSDSDTKSCLGCLILLVIILAVLDFFGVFSFWSKVSFVLSILSLFGIPALVICATIIFTLIALAFLSRLSEFVQSLSPSAKGVLAGIYSIQRLKFVKHGLALGSIVMNPASVFAKHDLERQTAISAICLALALGAANKPLFKLFGVPPSEPTAVQALMYADVVRYQRMENEGHKNIDESLPILAYALEHAPEADWTWKTREGNRKTELILHIIESRLKDNPEIEIKGEFLANGGSATQILFEYTYGVRTAKHAERLLESAPAEYQLDFKNGLHELRKDELLDVLIEYGIKASGMFILGLLIWLFGKKDASLGRCVSGSAYAMIAIELLYVALFCATSIVTLTLIADFVATIAQFICYQVWLAALLPSFTRISVAKCVVIGNLLLGCTLAIGVLIFLTF